MKIWVIDKFVDMTYSGSKFGNVKNTDESTGIKYDSYLERECHMWIKCFKHEIELQKTIKVYAYEKELFKIRIDYYIKIGDEEIYIDAKTKATFTPEAKLRYKIFKIITGNSILLYPEHANEIERKLISEVD